VRDFTDFQWNEVHNQLRILGGHKRRVVTGNLVSVLWIIAGSLNNKR
jgi:hypothetical protein